MGAEANALCGADYGERSPERVNIRNGYRERRWGHARRHDRASDPEAPAGLLRMKVKFLGELTSSR
jgi:Transposase, Mutator family